MLGIVEVNHRGIKARQPILIVEDERASRDALTRLLHSAGYDIDAAASAEEALALVDQTPSPLVVLVDIDLPGMDGLEFIARLEDLNAQAVPIVVTAKGSVAFQHQVKAMGLAYLQKPIIFSELLQLITELSPKS